MENKINEIVVTDKFCSMDVCGQLSFFHIIHRGVFKEDVCLNIKTIISSLGFESKDVICELLDNGYLMESKDGYRVIIE